MEFYSTAAQVIPTLLIVAALQSRLLSWAAEHYSQNGFKRRMGQTVMFAIGGSLLCEAVALAVLAWGKEWLFSCWALRVVVLLGCLAALLVAWGGGHSQWTVLRDAAKQLQAALQPATPAPDQPATPAPSQPTADTAKSEKS
jgi:hypothetical protein